MTARKHPGGTGAARPIEWALTSAKREELAEWIHGWKLKRADVPALIDAIESSARLYLQFRQLAEESSAGSVRRNLKKALEASERLLAQVRQLDGNSLQLIRYGSEGKSIVSDVAGTHRILSVAYEQALARYPLRGRRPLHERDALAALLADALETHTSAKPTARRAEIFESLLIETFALVGEDCADLHTLAERVLKRKLVSRPSEGVTVIDTY